jgi:NO-binding membrane sensor protein with MHYT domain
MAGSSSTIYHIGDVVPYHFNVPIVVASCLVALLGSITTVELLHRKRGTRGWINWYDMPLLFNTCSNSFRINQLGISVSLGLVAIWCMHFVGNRAIILGDGSSLIQLNYNAGFTALSAFLPIIFLFVAFNLLEIQQPEQRLFWPFLITSGFISGLSITGMHYVGNFGISNYKLHNPAPYVVGASAIAIVASISALALFFYFKEKWVNSLAMRLSCATVLAAAVSGMYWVASKGTTYTLKVQSGGDSSHRNVNLIVAMICVSWTQLNFGTILLT